MHTVGEDSIVVKTSSGQFLFRPSSSASSFPFSVTPIPAVCLHSFIYYFIFFTKYTLILNHYLLITVLKEATVTASEAQVAYVSSSSLFYSNSSGKHQATLSSSLSPSSLFLLSPSPYLLTVGEDWRASVLNLKSFFSSSSYLWEREEALAGIVRTEVIELPPGILF